MRTASTRSTSRPREAPPGAAVATAAVAVVAVADAVGAVAVEDAVGAAGAVDAEGVEDVALASTEPRRQPKPIAPPPPRKKPPLLKSCVPKRPLSCRTY